MPRLFKSNENYVNIDQLSPSDRANVSDIREAVRNVDVDDETDILQWELQVKISSDIFRNRILNSSGSYALAIILSRTVKTKQKLS